MALTRIKTGGITDSSVTTAKINNNAVTDAKVADAITVTGAQTGITQVGTLTAGTWEGTKVASAYLDDDTAHLSTTQTFTGAKTFTGETVIDGGTALAGGWGRSLTLEHAFPVLAFRSEYSTDAWGAIGYDNSTGMKFFVNSSDADVPANGTLGLTILDNGTATFTGSITTTSAGTANAPSLAIDNPSSSSYIHALEAFGANMTQGQTHIFCLGKEGSTKNTAVLGYKWDSAGSNDNLFTIEHWGTGPLVTVDGVGNSIFAGELRVNGGQASIYGAEGADAVLELNSDEADDNADRWQVYVDSSDSNNFKFRKYSTGSWVDTFTISTGGDATFAADINMTGGQKKMTLANSSNTPSSMLRISNRSSVTPSWADEYICEIHGNASGTNSEVLLFLHQHENSSDRPILRAMNGDNTTQIEFGSNQQYKFRGEMCIGDNIYSPDAPLMVKAPGTDGGGMCRLESTSTSSNPEGILVYYPSNSSTSGWAFYQANSAEGKSMIHNNGDFDSRTNSYGGWSDERIKTNIADANSQWDDIKNIRIRNFKYKSSVAEHGDDAQTFLGAVAQEVESISPSLVEEIIPSKYEIENCGFGEKNADGEWVVKKDENGKDMTVKTMKYSILYMKAVKCLQEAMEKIETLESKVDALENA
tara:strand:- start:45 stop:1982 length:1938 start_codon:yes stop_codon:yes gene_type:complete